MENSTLFLDAHNATEEFIEEANLALAIPEKSKVEDGTNVVADWNSQAPFVPSAPLVSSTLISDAHIAAETFIQEATLALEIPQKSKVEDGTNVTADENSEAPFAPSAPLASSTLISDAHIGTEEFIQEATLALEIPEKSTVEDGTNVAADENSKAPFAPSAPFASSTLISDAHIATEEFIQEATLALEIPEKSKVEDGTNVAADESSKAPFAPSAPLASTTLIPDAHIATEEFIQEATLALEIPEKSKVEDGTNVAADENSKVPFAPSAPLASTTLISDAHIATEEFIQEATLALEIPEKSKVEDGTNVAADENSKAPFAPSAPLTSSACISDAHIGTEEFIKQVTLALEIPEKSKVEDGTNVAADENSKAPFAPSAPLASTTLIPDAHIATEEFIQEATLALEIPEKSKVEDGTNVAADENSKVPFVPSAPLASSTLISDAHIATEEFIQEATMPLAIPEKSKVEDGTNVVADDDSESLRVPFAPFDGSTYISDPDIATGEFIQEAALVLEILEKSKLEESNNIAADEKSESPRVPSALLDSSSVASTTHIPSALRREGSLKADGCVVHDEKTEASCRSSVRTNN